MNTRKTEVLHSLNSNSDPAQLITICGNTLNEVQGFTYLRNIIANNCSLEREVSNRISKTRAEFGQLAERVYLNRNLKLPTKIKVYQAIVLSSLA